MLSNFIFTTDNKRGSSTDGKGGATVEQKEVHEEERQTTKVDRYRFTASTNNSVN